ncbi:hypothetical protein [Halorhabdus salina]|uniref:hypothetical protein n=1 Tax=Halorhabdus salina TaxID=2750670 RepID=UPI00215D7DF8|nr:hypothetical protein [Halorhabdus salina]
MNEVSLVIDFDERAQRGFEKGNFNVSVGVRLQVGETYILGSSDAYTRDFIEPYVIGLLEGAIAALDEERYVFDYYIDAMYLVFEPVDEGRTNLAFCYSEEAVENPDYRGEQSPKLPEPEAVAPTRELAVAIADGAQTYLDTIREYDSDAGSDYVEPLLDELCDRIDSIGK